MHLLRTIGITYLGMISLLSFGLEATSLAAQQSHSTYTVRDDRLGDALHRVSQNDSPLLKKISLTVVDLPLGETLAKISQIARVEIRYTRTVVPSERLVSLNVRDVPIQDVLTRLLSGTEIEIAVVGNGVIVLTPPRGERHRQSQSPNVGVVAGRVVDSATGKGIVGVMVAVQDLKLSTATNEKGEFSIPKVPIGEHSVTARLFGFRAATQVITVTEGKTTSMQFRLVATPTELSGVVTTATGIQRRIEVGNDITVIKVDSIIKTMPVTNLSDLLATRVPGMVVSPTTGSPGSPSLVRIRGASSINTSNDPMLLVDGVRVYAEQIDQSSNQSDRSIGGSSSGALVGSPLDQIDLNSIENVEVLKGPSAVALYGIDAANGVILVTTKRGQAGPMQWSANGTWGQTTMPGKWPMNAAVFGHLFSEYLGTHTEGALCNITNMIGNEWSTARCFLDSVVYQQILNDAYTTVFGRGQTRTYRADIRGGSRELTYAFSASISKERGLVKLPDADVAVLTALGKPIPQWQRRPELSELQSATAKIGADVNDKTLLTFTTTLTRSHQHTTPLRTAPQIALSPLTETIGSGLLGAIPGFRNRITSSNLQGMNTIDVRAHPLTWLTATANAGVTVSNRTDLSKFGREDCATEFGSDCGDTLANPDVPGGGFINVMQMQVLASTVRGNISMPFSLSRWSSIRTSIGGDFHQQRVRSLGREGKNLPIGATSGNQAGTQLSSESYNARSDAGFYIETRLGFLDRFYLPFSLRTDAGSGLGANIHPTFPRLAFSYLVSDMPAFRRIPLVGLLNMMRLRTAYGQSGKQPSVAAKLRTYQMRSAIVNGTAVSTVQLYSYGNPELRPERVQDWEFGTDIDFWDNRISTTLTFYHKNTFDALIDLTVPPSVLGAQVAVQQQFNIGNVQNRGVEFSITSTVLRGRQVGWTINANASGNRNRLVKLGRPGYGLAFSDIRFVEGYPLNGYWSKPLLGWKDADENGILDPSEVILADSPVYRGVSTPDLAFSLHNTFTFFGQVTLGTSFQYQGGFTQKRTTGQSIAGDVTLPLYLQAYLRQGPSSSASPDYQRGSWFRFDALSLGYIVPRTVSRKIGLGRTLRFQVQGRNLALWSNYRGLDPSVSSSLQEYTIDAGSLPKPRVWQFNVGIN